MKTLSHSFSTLKVPIFFLLLLLISSCTIVKKKPIEIVLTSSPDDGGTFQTLLDTFNVQNPDINVIWHKASVSSDTYFKIAYSNINQAIPVIDIFSSDVVWTSALAETGNLVPLDDLIFEEYKKSDFIESSLRSATYDGKLYAAPMMTDAGILFYRKDLLEDAGYAYPPTTWDELIGMAKKIQASTGIKYGYVFQGADYEGGVTNACEFIWNSGGDLISESKSAVPQGRFEIDRNAVTLDSPEARDGLAQVEKLIKSGILPDDIHEFREFESGAHFIFGRAIFLRSWTGASGMLNASESVVSPESVGYAPLPVSKKTLQSHSCSGGWNLVLNAACKDKRKQKAAKKLILYLISESSQRFRAEKGGILPPMKKLYEDPELLAKSPVINFGKKVIPVSKERPRVKNYAELSALISENFSLILKQEITSDEAINNLNAKMTGAQMNSIIIK